MREGGVGNEDLTRLLGNIANPVVGPAVIRAKKPVAETRAALKMLKAIRDDGRKRGVPEDRLELYSLQVLKGVVDEDPLLRFVTDEYQDWFMRSAKKYVLLVAANQIGKTTVLLLDAILRCLDRHPFHKYNRPVYVVVGTPNETSGKESIIPKLEELLPWHEVKRWAVSDTGKLASAIEFHNGSRIRILTYAQDRTAWQSLTADVVEADEQPLEVIFSEMRMRVMARGGSIRIGLTALECLHHPGNMGWFKDFVESGRNDGTLDYRQVALSECPRIDAATLAEKTREFSDKEGNLTPEGRVRVLGELILGGGFCVFPVDALNKILDELRSSPPVCEEGSIKRAA